MEDYLKFITDRYDLNFSSAIRVHMCLGILYVISHLEPDYKIDLQSEDLIAFSKKASKGEMSEEMGHQLFSKIIFDALFDNPNPNYRAPLDNMLETMLSGSAPFDNVNLVLVTHNHPDHFSPKFAARFMENNPYTTLIAAKDAVDAMKTNINEWDGVKDWVFYFEMEPGYLAGKLAAFEGDGLEKEKIDLALVHSWFPLHPDGERIILDILKPAHVGLIHLPKRLESDAPNKIDAVKSLYKDIFLFVEPGEKKILRF
jgi:hypothetical protein